MKVGIFSDLHLQKGGKKIDGVWDKKLVDGLATLSDTCDMFLEKDIDKFIFLGDMFDKRYQIDVQVLHGAIEILERLKDVPGHFLVGNHDMYLRTREINSLRFCSFKWKVVDTDWDNLEPGYLFVPYQKMFDDDDYKKINMLCKDKIVCMHQMLRGFSYQTDYTPYGAEVFD